MFLDEKREGKAAASLAVLPEKSRTKTLTGHPTVGGFLRKAHKGPTIRA
jgi:hypothetical protein